MHAWMDGWTARPIPLPRHSHSPHSLAPRSRSSLQGALFPAQPVLVLEVTGGMGKGRASQRAPPWDPRTQATAPASSYRACCWLASSRLAWNERQSPEVTTRPPRMTGHQGRAPVGWVGALPGGGAADLGVPGLARLQQGLDGADPLRELRVLRLGLVQLPVDTAQLLAPAPHLSLGGLQLAVQLCGEGGQRVAGCGEGRHRCPMLPSARLRASRHSPDPWVSC